MTDTSNQPAGRKCTNLGAVAVMLEITKCDIYCSERDKNAIGRLMIANMGNYILDTLSDGGT